MVSPKISINLITYNRSKYLPKAIDSVLKQSFIDWELIIIDDGSTDDTKNIVEQYSKRDQRIKYCINHKNLGISKSRNLALQKSAGQYLAVLDSDDYWCDNNKLQKQYDFLEKKSDYVLTGGNFIKVDENDNEIGRVKNPSSDQDIRNKFLFKNPITHSTVMYKKDLAIKLGGYDEKLEVGEDYDLWLKIAQRGKVFNFVDIFVKYKVHADNICLRDKLKSLKVLNVIKKYKGVYPNYYRAFLKRWSKLTIGKLFLKR